MLDDDARIAREVIERFTIPKPDIEEISYHELSCADSHYLGGSSAIQCIALQYSTELVPAVLVEALFYTIQKFPTVGSCLVVRNENNFFQLHAEDINLYQIKVHPSLILDVDEWAPAFQRIRKTIPRDNKPIFDAFLFRSYDEPCGCVLMAGDCHLPSPPNCKTHHFSQRLRAPPPPPRLTPSHVTPIRLPASANDAFTDT
jgi:hypothetical protein